MLNADCFLTLTACIIHVYFVISCLGIIVKMEHYTSYIGCEISEVPLSDAAQRIMSALQSVPTGIQTSRKNNQSE